MLNAQKHHLVIFTLLALLLCAAFAKNATAGAWVLPVNEINFHPTLLHYTSDKFYDEKRNRLSQDRYKKYEVSLFAEYGLTDQVTVGANIPVSISSSSRFDEWNLGIADPEFFVRTPLWQGEYSVISLQPLLKLPSLSQDKKLPRSGTEEWDAEMRFLAGTGFEWLDRSQYLDAALAYRKRFGEPSDQVRFDLTLGIEFMENLTFMPQVFSSWRLSDSETSNLTQIFDNDYNVIKTQASVLYDISDGTALQFGVFHDAYGKNIGQGNGAFLSTWYKF